MKRAVVFQAPREGYGIDQITGNAITVSDRDRRAQWFCVPGPDPGTH